MARWQHGRSGGLLLGVLVWFAHGAVEAEASDPLSDSSLVRDPIGVVRLENPARYAVLNRRSQSLSLVDPTSWEVVSELSLGANPSAIAALPESRRLLIAFFHKAEVCEYHLVDDGVLKPRRVWSVTRYPGFLAVSPDGRMLAVSGLWSRAISLIDLSRKTKSAVLTVPLPFSPGETVWLPGNTRLLVCDAFGGRLALIDRRRPQRIDIGRLAGHNLRGVRLSRDGRAVLMVYQQLSPDEPTTRSMLITGRLMKNLLARVPITELKTLQGTVTPPQLVRLGEWESGAGDPCAVSETAEKTMAVLSAGTGQLLFLDSLGDEQNRIPVGEGPVTMIKGEVESQLVILNRFSQSFSIVDMRLQSVVRRVCLGPLPTELSPADRGERLFYDARLSHGDWISCHSCHVNGHTSGGLADTKADGTFGTPKRILSLLGTRDNNPWAWNGQFRELHQQVQASVTSSMRGKPLSPGQLVDLVSFLHTLDFPPPRDANARPAQIAAGRRLFEKLRCGRCHIPPLTYTSDATFDVGFQDEAGLRKFNPPSLRGVGHLDRLLHDGRTRSLEQLFREEAHQIDEELSDSELDDLIHFLRSL